MNDIESSICWQSLAVFHSVNVSTIVDYHSFCTTYPQLIFLFELFCVHVHHIDSTGRRFHLSRTKQSFYATIIPHCLNKRSCKNHFLDLIGDHRTKINHTLTSIPECIRRPSFPVLFATKFSILSQFPFHKLPFLFANFRTHVIRHFGINVIISFSNDYPCTRSKHAERESYYRCAACRGSRCCRISYARAGEECGAPGFIICKIVSFILFT